MVVSYGRRPRNGGHTQRFLNFVEWIIDFIDDNVRGQNTHAAIPESLAGGDLGPERKLDCPTTLGTSYNEMLLCY